MIRFLLPGFGEEEGSRHLAELAKREPMPRFSKTALDFLQTVSGAILRDPAMRRHPELMAAAFWLRRPQLEAMQRDAEARAAGKLHLPRGVALHFAPSNVDTIFLYSWALSLLAGNSNIVRLSQSRSEQTERLLEVLDSALRSSEEFAPIRERTAFISYPHDAETTKRLSALCDVRVIWGGDETVRAIRSVPLPPLSTELAFANRFSLAALSSGAVAELAEEPLRELVHQFYNDAFWFHQMACSSPRLVWWIGGEAETEAARRKFWPALADKLRREGYELPAAAHMARWAAALSYAARPYAVSHSPPNASMPQLVGVEELPPEAREAHGGAGLFLEQRYDALADAARAVTRKDQTLAYFGFDREELAGFARQVPAGGVDRIVPVGQALQFGGVWDGYHLLTHFSREVEIR